MLTSVCAFLENESNREILGWIGGGVVVIIGGLSAALRFFQEWGWSPVSGSLGESSPRLRKPIAGLSRVLRLTVATGLLLGLGLSRGTTAEPEPPAAKAAPAADAAPQPTAAELESWRREIHNTPRPNGCFTAVYPDKQWREVPCKTPPHKLYPPRRPGLGKQNEVGNGPFTDFSALAPSNRISEAHGSFPVVNNVTSECAVPCPNGVCPPNPTCTGQPPDTYSLQLNTKPFTGTEACNGSPNPNTCQGWEQFIYSTSGGGGFIQYWLLNYGPPGTSCPPPIGAFCTPNSSESDGWCPGSNPTDPVDCVIDSKAMTPTPAEPITALGALQVSGAVAGVNATNDTVTVADGTASNTTSGDNYFPDLGRLWTEAEFNVFGDGDGDQAVFNIFATIEVRIELGYGALSGPVCEHESFTGESNNLNLATPPYPSSSPGRPKHGRPVLPALVFHEAIFPFAWSSASCLPPGYQNVGYVDGNGHVQDASYPLGLGQNGPWWQFTDIQGDAPLVFSGSGLTSWFDATNQHVVYIGGNGDVLDAFQPFGPSGGPQWQVTDITGQTGAPGAPYSASGLTSWHDFSYGHVAYIDFNSHVQDAFYPLGQSAPQWQVTDITPQTGAQAFSLTLTSWAPYPYQHIAYIGAYNHVLQAYRPFGQTGSTQVTDINEQTGAPVASGGSPLTSWVDATNQHVAYVDFNSHVREVFAPLGESGSAPTGSASPWQVIDITGQTGAFASSGSGLTSWVDGTYQHVAYMNSVFDAHVLDAYRPVGQSVPQWNVIDITNQSGAPVATSVVNGALTSWLDGTYGHLAYIDSNSHVQDAFYPLGQSPPQWQVTDISAQPGAPVTASGSSLTSWISGP
jgi:hypothetical protein